VPESATKAQTLTEAPSRSARRHANAHRIAVCAQELAAEHGLDGFTMEDLAGKAGVSRRTLFNYFPSKDDAVLGGTPEIDAELAAEFRAGGPTGNLIDDVAVIVRSVLEAKDFTREELARARQVMRANPRLIALAHRRIEESVEAFMDAARVRSGPDFDEHRSKAAVAVMLAVFHVALEQYLSDVRRRSLPELFDQTLQTTRDLLA
jgi:AcrR family transcriptional regulator